MKAAQKDSIADFYLITTNTFINEKPLKDWVSSFGDKFEDFFVTDYDPFEIKLIMGKLDLTVGKLIMGKLDLTVGNLIVRKINWQKKSVYCLYDKEFFENNYVKI
jgi:hypothetical protein